MFFFCMVMPKSMFTSLYSLKLISYFIRRTVTNKMTGQNVLLTKEDTKMIQQIYGKKHPTASGEELYAVSWLSEDNVKNKKIKSNTREK